MNQSSISFLRRRKQRSGSDYYYLEIPKCRPRQEVCLGTNFEDALIQREVLLTQYFLKLAPNQDLILPMLELFELIQVPTMDTAAKRENIRSLRHLQKFFREHPNYRSCDIGSTGLQEEYRDWRGHHLLLTSSSELSLLSRAAAKVKGWIALAAAA